MWVYRLAVDISEQYYNHDRERLGPWSSANAPLRCTALPINLKASSPRTQPRPIAGPFLSLVISKVGELLEVPAVVPSEYRAERPCTATCTAMSSVAPLQNLNFCGPGRCVIPCRESTVACAHMPVYDSSSNVVFTYCTALIRVCTRKDSELVPLPI